MDAHDDGFLYGVANLAGDFVCPAHAFFQGNVVAFGDQEFDIDASELEVLYDCSGNLAVVLVLPEASVGRAFARGFNPVAVVNQYFHFLQVLCRLQI